MLQTTCCPLELSYAARWSSGTYERDIWFSRSCVEYRLRLIAAPIHTFSIDVTGPYRLPKK